jgi:hypothetical protein
VHFGNTFYDEERDHLGHIDAKIIIKWNVNETLGCGLRFIWFRIGSIVTGCCEHDNEFFESIKRRWISSSAAVGFS